MGQRKRSTKKRGQRRTTDAAPEWGLNPGLGRAAVAGAIAAPGIGGVTTRSDLKEANPTTPPAAMDDPRTDESGAT